MQVCQPPLTEDRCHYVHLPVHVYASLGRLLLVPISSIFTTHYSNIDFFEFQILTLGGGGGGALAIRGFIFEFQILTPKNGIKYMVD